MTLKKVPEWWRDAKLGIFIHWGVYSVPGYAPVNATEPENLRDLTDSEGQLVKMRGMPYAEWYYNTLRLVFGVDFNSFIHNAISKNGTIS